MLPATERFGEKLGAPFEMPVKAALGDAEARGERFDGERAESGFGDKMQRGFGPVGSGEGGLVKAFGAGAFMRHCYLAGYAATWPIYSPILRSIDNPNLHTL